MSTDVTTDAPPSATRRRTRASSITGDNPVSPLAELDETPRRKRTPAKAKTPAKSAPREKPDEKDPTTLAVTEEEEAPIAEAADDPPSAPASNRKRKSEAVEQDSAAAAQGQKAARVEPSNVIPVSQGLKVPTVIPSKSAGAEGGGSKAAPVKEHLLKGRNVSGRPWKRQKAQQRASTFMRNDKLTGRSKPWAARQAAKEAKAELRALEAQLKEAQRQDKVAKRQLAEERAALRAANEMKNTVMQTITKTHKLKTMNKKQLRQIKKTALNAKTGQVELVSPWQK